MKFRENLPPDRPSCLARAHARFGLSTEKQTTSLIGLRSGSRKGGSSAENQTLWVDRAGWYWLSDCFWDDPACRHPGANLWKSPDRCTILPWLQTGRGVSNPVKHHGVSGALPSLEFGNPFGSLHGQMKIDRHRILCLKIDQSGSTGISCVKRSDSVEVHVRIGVSKMRLLRYSGVKICVQ